VQLTDEDDDLAVDLSGDPAGDPPPYVGHDREGKRHWWRVSCRDVINRSRFLTVLIDRDRVVLVGPPGETAVMSQQQVGQLVDALREASGQAGG
jgi:hypothetical protein